MNIQAKNDLGRIWMKIGTSAPEGGTGEYDNGVSDGEPYDNNALITLLSGFSSDNNTATTVSIGGTDYEIFSISYQEYANYNVNNISETKYVHDGTNYYIPGRYINEYNDYYPLSPRLN